jgi:hypothetical protein
MCMSASMYDFMCVCMILCECMCVLNYFCLILFSTQQTPLFLTTTWCYDFMQKSLDLMLACVKQKS